ncbi:MULTISPECIES: site-specific integrase [Burkholderiales]|jgi:integrase|uniref:Phage integrase family protein n=1 Tax=Hydrogenophaga pseudoflava TaxID=47421 RepID=A0A4P6X1V0_HYDPS|nr:MULTISPECIES: site-specific integrase [Burkholderiales]MCM2337150.1 hypothetical protein [Lysobacter sp.]QBM28536.1 hypothetical protein HPF_12620 [Hydrogenophaga pseudoflava]
MTASTAVPNEPARDGGRDLSPVSNDEGSAFEGFEPDEGAIESALEVRRILSVTEISLGAKLIMAHSHQPTEDLALYYILFAIGARPLEIARLEVQDYLEASGDVSRISFIRPEVAINGRTRPLYFLSARLDEVMADYLGNRGRRGDRIGGDSYYRGLDPRCPLFLSPSGQGFAITSYEEKGQRRFLCRGIQEAYRKLLRYAGFSGLTALAARQTLADRLYSRGADEAQVGLLLGIADRSAVRERFPRRQPTLEELTKDLI